jgi:hypothetical protein
MSDLLPEAWLICRVADNSRVCISTDEVMANSYPKETYYSVPLVPMVEIPQPSGKPMSLTYDITTYVERALNGR